MSDENAIADAVELALNDVLGVTASGAPTGQRTYDYDDVPDDRPDVYVEHTIDRAFGGSERMCGSRATVLWRVTTRVVGRSVSDARVLRRRIGTLEDLPIPGIADATPLRFESQEPIGPDGDWYSGLTTWTFEAPFRYPAAIQPTP